MTTAVDDLGRNEGFEDAKIWINASKLGILRFRTLTAVNVALYISSGIIKRI
jgi:hypothetical protein